MEFESGVTPEISERLKGKWVAVVDDVPEAFEDIVRYGMKLDGVVKLQSFTTCEQFIPRSHEFDICLLDGNFGPGRLEGPASIPTIRQHNPEIYIIGSSSEPDCNEEFKEMGADITIDKMNLVEELAGALGDYKDDRAKK